MNVDRSYRLRHTIFVDAQGWAAIRPDHRHVDTFDTADATHNPLTDGEELVGETRFTPLDNPNLPQTVFSGLVQKDLPASPSHGADRARIDASPYRRECWRRDPESVAFLCRTREHRALRGVAETGLAPPGPADLH